VIPFLLVLLVLAICVGIWIYVDESNFHKQLYPPKTHEEKQLELERSVEELDKAIALLLAPPKFSYTVPPPQKTMNPIPRKVNPNPPPLVYSKEPMVRWDSFRGEEIK
jgi:hypothetical protein